MNTLPLDIVKHILAFEGKFVIRHGNIIQINKISKNDERYPLLQTIQPKSNCVGDPLIRVYISINTNKTLYITYRNYTITVSSLFYCEYDDEYDVINVHHHLII